MKFVDVMVVGKNLENQFFSRSQIPDQFHFVTNNLNTIDDCWKLIKIICHLHTRYWPPLFLPQIQWFIQYGGISIFLNYIERGSEHNVDIRFHNDDAY